MTDALSLQFVLPGPGQSLPPPRITPTDVPTIDLLLHTSVWAASILKALPGNPQYRPLIALGVAGVGSGWVAGYTAADGRWWKHVVHVAGDVVYAAPPEEEQVPVESLLADEDPLQGLMLDTYGTCMWCVCGVCFSLVEGAWGEVVGCWGCSWGEGLLLFW